MENTRVWKFRFSFLFKPVIFIKFYTVFSWITVPNSSYFCPAVQSSSAGNFQFKIFKEGQRFFKRNAGWAKMEVAQKILFFPKNFLLTVFEGKILKSLFERDLVALRCILYIFLLSVPGKNKNKNIFKLK